MPPAGQPGAIAPPTQPMAPFVLTAQEDAEVQKALLAWERACSGLNDVKCAFHRKDVNPTFGTETHYDGEIKYKKPDKARYYAKSEAVAGQAQEQEQYFCDGLSLYEWNYKNKQLIQHILPEDMRGAAIADGPLPFLFTATAEKLRNRYFLRLVTPANEKASVWIEAYPRHQQDAATFSKATVILDLKTMLPSAVEMYEPDRITRRVHTFGQFRTNDPLNWLKDPMAKPLPQLGWKFVVDDPQAEAAARAAKEGPMRK